MEGFSGRIVKVAKVPKLTDPESVRVRDRMLLKLSEQGRPSREIGKILNLNAASVRRIRSRLARQFREYRDGPTARVG